jgi:hypothetical protein
MQVSIAADGAAPPDLPPSPATIFFLALRYFSLHSLGAYKCLA